jgi:hypothetical protein
MSLTYHVKYHVYPPVRGRYPYRQEIGVDQARLDELARADWVLSGATAHPIGVNEPTYLVLTTTGIGPARRTWARTEKTFWR